MPELPEVEITRRLLTPDLVGRRICALRTTRPSYFFLTPPATLVKKVTGRTVVSLNRIGKYLLAKLDDDSQLLLHLGMTGQLFTEGAQNARLGAYPDQHTHVTFEFQEGGRVFFRDVRKFGKVRWLEPGATDPRIEKLGPDALGTTGDHLYAAALRRKAPVKTLLLDQKVVAGVGNIYADEALFLAKLRPAKRSHKLTQANCELLALQIRQVLQRSIEAGGSTISDFVAPDGKSGSYQDQRSVYGRQGEGCLDCSTAIRRLVIGQRSSFFCPSCQS
ncbi:MAG: bifunctional DNA-formamidopyrimidine glycosylase/DNA-(apurinic or apyrimidinic site) lyase [Pseudomonadota bacterium]|jgi:formamidopyrimidine-DNA glycosylase